MKRMSVIAVLLVVLALAAAPLFGAGQGEAKDEELTVGVVLPYEIGWFSAFHDGFELVAEEEGVEINWQYHNYNANEETTAIQNLITVGVDAINVTSATPDSAEYSARLANEANIPIQITESGIAEGEGKPFADIDFNWSEIYHTVATELRSAEEGELKVLWLQGFLGTPPVMQGIEGFKEKIAELDDISLATDPQDGQYATEPSLNITKTFVQAGLDFNVAMGASQEITEGIIQGLKEENVSLDDVVIVTVNGGPTDIQNLREGEIDYCLSISPGLHGMICAQNLINYLKGETYQEKTYSPLAWCTQDNWEERLIPWDVDETWMPLVREFVETGQYNPELRP
ncbi:MAG: sugar ABC transporter substrate-binding protein [Spirochaetia bacterium]